MEKGFDRPVFLRVERFDFHLAFDDDPKRDGLDAPGGAGAREFAPEHGRQVEPDQIIQCAAGEVGFHQIAVDLARVGHRLCHGAFRDCVEHDTADGRVLLQCLAVPKGFFKVPADRFTFAIRVGREDQFRVIFQGVRDGLDVLFRIARDLPLHLEPVIRIDRSILWRQVADMAV